MVAKNIQLTEIKVKGKSKIGKKTDAPRKTLREESQHLIGRKRVPMDAIVVNDIRFVVELPRNLKRVEVKKGGKTGQNPDYKKTISLRPQ